MAAGKTRDELMKLGSKTKFSSENQPEKSGRKPKVFSQIALEFKARGIERATPEAVAEIYEYILALPFDEINQLAFGEEEKKEIPSIMSLAAQEMFGKRALDVLKEMLDRAHGKSINRHEVAGKDGGAIKFDYGKLSIDELRQLSAIRKKATSNGDNERNAADAR